MYAIRSYYEFTGQFDRVVSVGMMEHVGVGRDGVAELGAAAAEVGRVDQVCGAAGELVITSYSLHYT